RELVAIGGAGKARHERHQQLMAKVVSVDAVIERERIRGERPGKAGRAILHRTYLAVGKARRDDGRFVDAGAAVGPGEFMAAREQFPIQYPIEIMRFRALLSFTSSRARRRRPAGWHPKNAQLRDSFRGARLACRR